MAIPRRAEVAIFAIRRTDTGRLIGTCQLRDIDPDHRSAELVIRIGEPDERGQGRGTRAVEMLISYGFHDLDLHFAITETFDVGIAEMQPQLAGNIVCQFRVGVPGKHHHAGISVGCWHASHRLGFNPVYSRQMVFITKAA